MKVSEKEVGGITVLYPEGEVDVYNCNALKANINRLVQAGRNKIVVNMSGVSYMDSSAIGALVSGETTAKNAGGGVRISNLNKQVAKVFEITRLTTFFKIYPDEEEALAGF